VLNGPQLPEEEREILRGDVGAHDPRRLDGLEQLAHGALKAVARGQELVVGAERAGETRNEQRGAFG
jgi:hypothetical protein